MMLTRIPLDPRVGHPSRRLCRFAGCGLIGAGVALACSFAHAFQSDENGAAETETKLVSNGSDEENGPPVDLNEILDLSFDDLKFEMEKGADFKESMLTDELKKLDGRQVRIRGFIRPGFKQSGIKAFVLVRDNQECCFGPGAALYDCVMVKMAAENSIDFSVRPITVVGTMQLKKYIGKDKKVWAIFRLNETRQE